MKQNNIFNLLAAILTSSSAPDHPTSNELTIKDNKSSLLVENLRRQLMKDNYDYMTDESKALAIEHTTIQYHKKEFGDRAVVDKTKSSKENHHTYKRTTIDIPRGFDKQYVRSDNNPENRTKSEPVGVRRRPVMFHNNSKYLIPIENRKKLATAGREKTIYEYDDTKSRRQHNNEFVLKENSHADEEPVRFEDRKWDGNKTTEDEMVRYSVLKVKAGSRRSASAPHLVKEEKNEEVSIVNLGEGPLPEFRLPGARRQYMRELSDGPGSELSDAPDASDAPPPNSPVDLE